MHFIGKFQEKDHNLLIFNADENKQAKRRMRNAKKLAF